MVVLLIFDSQCRTRSITTAYRTMFGSSRCRTAANHLHGKGRMDTCTHRHMGLDGLSHERFSFSPSAISHHAGMRSNLATETRSCHFDASAVTHASIQCLHAHVHFCHYARVQSNLATEMYVMPIASDCAASKTATCKLRQDIALH